jgi:hypothetical protein
MSVGTTAAVAIIVQCNVGQFCHPGLRRHAVRLAWLVIIFACSLPAVGTATLSAPSSRIDSHRRTSPAAVKAPKPIK